MQFMSEFSSVKPPSEKSEPPSEKSAEKKVVEIIGINSEDEDLKSMVNTMVSDTKTEVLSTEYTLEVFINILINALKSETIPTSRTARAIRDLRDALIKNPNIVLAQKIIKTLENKDKNDSKTKWNQYLEDLKTSYMFLELNEDPNEQYKFRVLAPRLEGVISPEHHIHLNAYDVSEFLSGIEKHIINVANKHYNKINYQLGGRKYNRRKHKKKSLVNKRKTKKNSLIKKRKTKKNKKLPSKKKKN